MRVKDTPGYGSGIDKEADRPLPDFCRHSFASVYVGKLVPLPKTDGVLLDVDEY